MPSPQPQVPYADPLLQPEPMIPMVLHVPRPRLSERRQGWVDRLYRLGWFLLALIGVLLALTIFQ